MMSGGVRESLLSGLECEKHATIVLDHARVRMWVIHGVLARGLHTVQHQSLLAKGCHSSECGSGDTQRPATDHDVFARANGFERPRPTDDWQPASRKGRVP